MTSSYSDSTVASIVALAVGLHRQQQLDEAEELYRRALQASPNQVDALHFLGVLRHQRGDTRSATQLIRKALRIDPQYIDARINLGNVLKEQGRIDEAEVQYRKALAARPDSSDAYNNLGIVLRLQAKPLEAVESFQQAIALSPKRADIHQNLGNALTAANRRQEALVAYRRAIQIDPTCSDARSNLGRTLNRMGQLEEAIKVYHEWLEFDPSNPIAAHMHAACRGEQTVKRCSDEFVKQSFDAFAASFDAVLARLDYRAPQLVGEAIRAELPLPARQFRVLDAGCGTGLCGPWLREYASRLVGIDLSPNMIGRCEALGIYDELAVVELTDYMRQHPGGFDVIVSADTLVYFGELDSVFREAAAALNHRGVLVFTVEHGSEASQDMGYQLNPHGRFSHTQQFVVNMLERAGLAVSNIRRDVLRSEVQQPVDGLVITARNES